MTLKAVCLYRLLTRFLESVHRPAGWPGRLHPHGAGMAPVHTVRWQSSGCSTPAASLV